MGAFKDKILDELYKNNYAELYDIIDQMDSDVDVANYISSSKGYYPKMMSTKDLEGMPEFRKALYSDLKTGEVDIDKEFGKDWYKNYEQIPSDQIKFVADKQGVSYNTLVKEMGEQATKKRRHDIAHDGVPGVLMSAFTPRRQEAIERGEDPSWTDTGLDVGQNLLYMAPWGRVSAPLARLGRAGMVGQAAIGNAATPIIMETADAAAYGDDNPRGNWNGNDVITETTVNATMPWVIRGALMGAGKLATGKGRDLANKYMKFGTDRTTREEMPDILKGDAQGGYRKAAKYELEQQMPLSNNIRTRSEHVNYFDNKETEELRTKILNKLDLFYNGIDGKKIPGYKLELNNDEITFMSKDPILSKYLDIDNGFKNLPTNKQLVGEEALKNYITNQAGTYWYDEQSPWTRVPVVGTKIDKYNKDKEKEEQEQAVRDSILYDLLMKYGEPRGL